MKIPLHITFRNDSPNEAVEAEIRKRAKKLDQFARDVMRCDVTVGPAGKRHARGNPYEVHIDLTMAGKEIAISHVHSHEDVYVVIRDAFDAAIRKLQDHVRTRQGEVKAHKTPLHGRITKLFDEGYGFIETPDGRELYFSQDNLAYPDFGHIEVGAEVQFLEEAGAEGLQAKRVTAGKHPPPGIS